MVDIQEFQYSGSVLGLAYFGKLSSNPYIILHIVASMLFSFCFSIIIYVLAFWDGTRKAAQARSRKLRLPKARKAAR